MSTPPQTPPTPQPPPKIQATWPFVASPEGPAPATVISIPGVPTTTAEIVGKKSSLGLVVQHSETGALRDRRTT